MADEPAVAEPAAPATAPAESENLSFDTSQLDAILHKMWPPTDGAVPTVGADAIADGAPAPKSVESLTSKPVEPAPAAPVAPPAPVKPSSPFDPPPSVLGEASVAVAAPVEGADEYGTLPEQAPAEFKSKEAKASYAKMRENHERLKADLRTEREARKAAPPVDEGLQAQLNDLTARNAELNAIVERKSIEDHPYVRQTFDEPRRQLYAIAKKALEKIDVDSGTLGKILSLDGKERVEAMDELYSQIESPSTRDKVTSAIAQIDTLEEQRAAFLEDRKGNVERMTQAEKAEQYRQFAAQEKAIDDSATEAIDLLANKIGFEHWKKSSDPNAKEWNERIDEREKVLRYLSKENKDPKLLVRVLAAGVVAEDIRKWALSTNEQLKTAKAKLAEYEGSMPNLSGNGASDAPTARNGDEDLDAAGVLPTDDLQTMSRKLGAYMSRRG